ncbi:MAG: peptidase M19 [Cobetia sp.]|jgi:microsomal dipeptidase-like Zn-dependent dipeptidase|nr:peptidase M19 [Cobetia sp.]MBK10815.1 peptidase M19 [Cobetia sp.]MBR9754270.1 membrane dipeptidase [Gammaproteobacteria bacterium]MBR9799126.1 membrane dipeptidase [Gammaproteobacteria bacterium]HBJ27215.1 peptidase M19 [Cobetia sp.]|tara:strand:- start:3072 stop:4061 length:990 start_codon:yes stop_codon:yes gene_type:complete
MLTIDGLQYSNWSREIFEQMREGGLDAVHATLVYHETTRETLSRLGEWNRRFEAWPDLIMPVHVPQDIAVAQASGRVGIILGAQNCSPIEDDIDMVEVMRDLGLMIMQLTYNNQSLLACGCYEAEDSGITRFGRQVIREMNRVGMVIDMSHSAERSTLEAIEISERPVIISHANPESFHPAKRNKSDKVLKAIAESDGLLGFSAYPFHLRNGSDCTLTEYCEMIARTADLMGIEHLGIGTDLCQNQPVSILEWMRNGRWSKDMDYGEGSASNADWPRPLPWLRDSRDFPNLIAGLRKVGMSEDEVAGIMGKNWVALLERAATRQEAAPA